MAAIKSLVFMLFLAVITAAPNLVPEPVTLTENLRYDFQEGGQENEIFADQWSKLSDVVAPTNFNPDIQNVLHLFTRQNPTQSQPMLLGTEIQLSASNYDPARRTAIIIHGWTQSATSDINTVLVPAFLEAEDINVFVYDWSAGSSILQGTNGPENAVASGFSLARAIDWLSTRTGASTDHFHLVGFSLGAHLAAVAGRNVRTRIAYITALDPGANMEDSGHIFSSDAATYTEAIHTNSGIMGHGSPVAHADFFPNGGNIQPGCGVNFLCNHYRSFFFFAETLTSSGNWVATRCGTLAQARLGLCVSIFSLRMGGLQSKAGSSGLYHLSTNPEPPFQPFAQE